MLERTETGWVLVGSAGRLPVPTDDPLLTNLALIVEVVCEGRSVAQTAAKYGYSRQRFYQLKAAFAQHGMEALRPQKRGPKAPSKRTTPVVLQIIRHRFLDEEASPAVIAQKLRQAGVGVSIRSVERTLQEYGLQKKLWAFDPARAVAPDTVETHYTKTETRVREIDARGVERAVRQVLARKVSSTHAALWLLVPAHLQLGTWDLVTAWCGPQASGLAPRLALQMLHEAALCVTGLREQRTLGHRGFELLNGLPWIATDRSLHDLCQR
jgi:transposase